MLRAYGTRLFDLMGSTANLADLGVDFGGGLYEREVRYLMEHEWAQTADDVLWRRSKIGIGMREEQISALNNWMKSKETFSLTESASPPPTQ